MNRGEELAVYAAETKILGVVLFLLLVAFIIATVFFGILYVLERVESIRRRRENAGLRVRLEKEGRDNARLVRENKMLNATRAELEHMLDRIRSEVPEDARLVSEELPTRERER